MPPQGGAPPRQKATPMIFSAMTPAPPDPILGLTDAYRADPRPLKINLGVGVFMNAQGITPVLESVKRAERLILENEHTKTYLPIAGNPAFAQAVTTLLFGPDFPAARVAVLQSPGGTGALAAAAHLLAHQYPACVVHIPNPTWENHPAIFHEAGLKCATYPYLDPATKTVALDALCHALAHIPHNNAVLFHACCHNPTGAEISPDGWRRIATIASQYGWFPIIDFAYQGFGEGLQPDRLGLRILLNSVPEAMVCSSFSKNMGLYSERTGALSIVAPNPHTLAAAWSHAKQTARTLWSNPPRHGGAIVETILTSPSLRPLWEAEVLAMHRRITENRRRIASGLRERLPHLDFSFLENQRGMFSYLGFTPEQVARLREQNAVYIAPGGRINVAGLPNEYTPHLCNALAKMYPAPHPV